MRTREDTTQEAEPQPPGGGRSTAGDSLDAPPTIALHEALLLNRVAGVLASSLELTALVEALARELTAIGPVTGVTLLMHEHGRSFRSRASPSLEARLSPGLMEELRRERLVMGEELDDGFDPEWRRRLSSGSGIGFALVTGADLVGVAYLSTAGIDAFAARRELLREVAGAFSQAAANAIRYEEMRLLHMSTLAGLEAALNARDNYGLYHAARTSTYLVLLAEELGWDPKSYQQMVEACTLHDIGAMGISERVLLKRGPLDAEEWGEVREHPAIGADIIGPLFPDQLVLGVRHHHERYDGTGYPDGLAGEQIPLFARALCLVDSYDAMSLHRPYRPALSYTECLAEIRRCRGSQFDPVLTDAFLRVLERLRGRRATALAVAREAAATIDPRLHQSLREPADQETPAYRELAERLRAVRDAHPPVRFLTTQAWSGKRVIFVVDAEEEGSPAKSDLGDSFVMDEEVERVLLGQEADINVVIADDFGIWVSASTPLWSDSGEVLAAVAADMPALDRIVVPRFGEGSAPIVRTATARLGRAEVEAITDGLTGLYNRRYISLRLAEEVERAEQEGVELSVLFCDLDGFKAFNDEYGHSAGDRALHRVARVIERCVRRVDLVGRYGGEEILVVLPASDGAAACEVAERVRAAVADRSDLPAGCHLTISIGVASFPRDAQSTQELIDRADWAMYRAKRGGRDRVARFSR